MAKKELIERAQTKLLIQGDVSSIDRYWSDTCIQHNLPFANGMDEFRKARTPGPKVTYEVGFFVSEGALVMVHGRYTGIGQKPMIAVDIFRIVEGKIAEHWDVLQEEVTATVSGNSMFDPSEGK